MVYAFFCQATQGPDKHKTIIYLDIDTSLLSTTMVYTFIARYFKLEGAEPVPVSLADGIIIT